MSVATCITPVIEKNNSFFVDLHKGLSQNPRSISPKYFYDARGSALFDQICELSEYYPTRTEISILEKHGEEIAELIGANTNIIEFGAGSLTKIRLLLNAFKKSARPTCFTPIDISGQHLQQAASTLAQEFNWLRIQPIVADYMRLTSLPKQKENGAKLIGFFPGSTIGNMDRDEAFEFLQKMAQMLRGGGLLIGVDLVKSPACLHAAYNDKQGVTAAFNLNVLRRANNELGADFNLSGYTHHAFYNPTLQRVEMHLISQARQLVTIADKHYLFDEGDNIHTENSHKFTIHGFQTLAKRAGFSPRAAWVDQERLFSVHWLSA